MRMTKSSHLIHRRIANIVYRIAVLLFKKLNFKGKNGKKLINITFNVLYPIFLPSPYLWRNIIIDRYLSMRVNKLCNIQIETWIIYQNNNIRIPGYYIFFTTPHIGKDSAQMQQYRNKSHIS